MEVEVPVSYQTLSKMPQISGTKPESEPNPQPESNPKTFVKQRSILPAQDQLVSGQSSVELPPIQNVPVKKSSRQRSSSTGNNGSKPAQKKIVDITPIKEVEAEDRNQNPARTRIRLVPITTHLKNQSKDDFAVSTRPQVEIVDKDEECQQEQTPQTKEKNEPIRMRLNRIFHIVNQPQRKDPKQQNQPTTYTNDNKKEVLVQQNSPKSEQEITPKDLVFGPNVSQQVMWRHFFSVVQGVKYALLQMKPLPLYQLRPLQISLKRASDAPRKTLLLDLDETLIYVKRNQNNASVDASASSERDENNPLVSVKIRPHAQEFLKKMSREFEIIIFTAAEQSYAEGVVKLLDPELKYISHLLHRGHCLRTKRGLFIKDLRIILDRDLKDMVIVDNFTPSFSFQVDNGIPIITWHGDPKDEELKYLMPYLLEAKKCRDMRQYNREKLRLKDLADMSN